MTPPNLIRAILRAPVDLLFNGGIGTYIKAETENDVDVGDRANDTVRVNANQVRPRSLQKAAISVSPPGAASSSTYAAGGSTPTRWTTRPAWTARTTRSTSRSWSTR
ncbi:bacterial NAD-glutamate dehydrogenase family protein [Mycobacterium xenopi 4042]|uniref:Bacterial NAD-glutamate dehydrogenase family protein n=1 Tax=Mycobacterium xenopi 4042 TaxID=1299334 RepID=X8AQR6_MYCXE|nr:bacterial NAD-glutamate dehydrogenase family protein [Mycobacterium xenopi 4042]